MSEWVVCPRCHFSQIPAERCRRCGEVLGPASPSAPGAEAARAAEAPRSRTRKLLAAAAAVALLFGLLWATRTDRRAESPGPEATPVPTAGALDLSGNWHSQYSKMLGKTPPRPVLKEISIESGRDGGILSARVVFTDPGRGGAGAGYRTSSDGARRLADAAAALAANPRGAALAMDFVKLPGWIPERERVWRALEGARPGAEPAHYLLVESLETDYVVQAGINETGFLSYAFFSTAYAPARGEDILSRAIHPEPGASLRGFRDLVWDLSGAANFLTLQLPVTVSGPEGGAVDSVTLTR
jgi:hypothetical protein